MNNEINMENVNPLTPKNHCIEHELQVNAEAGKEW